jgi:hypothetical protein
MIALTIVLIHITVIFLAVLFVQGIQGNKNKYIWMSGTCFLVAGIIALISIILAVRHGQMAGFEFLYLAISALISYAGYVNLCRGRNSLKK